MNVGKSVSKAIDDWELSDFDSAMLHACNAVDGTAKKAYAHLAEKNNERFTTLLRDNYDILGPMGIPGIDLAATRFPVSVKRPKATGGKPDIADVIYGIHRCSHGHGDELPEGFELIPDAAQALLVTRTGISKGRVQLSDRIIFGLIAVAVLSPVNADQRVPDGYYLTYRDSDKLLINKWWGKRGDFLKIFEGTSSPLVTLDFKEWMDELQ